MARRRIQLSFGRKVLLLAVVLVTVVQAGTLVPVLSTIRADTEMNAGRSVRLAGVVFDEFMRNRRSQLETTVDVLAADFPFRNAIATRDEATIASVVANHAARAGTGRAAVFDLEGNVIASSGIASSALVSAGVRGFDSESDERDLVHGLLFVDGVPHQTITVPVRAPVTMAWVMLAFPIDEAFASGLARLTDLEVSIVGFDTDAVATYASTLASPVLEKATADMRPRGLADIDTVRTGDAYITALRPILEGEAGLYAALQLSMDSVVQSYERIRNALIVLAAAALLLAIAGAAWISRMVSSPLSTLADAARRMREGIYSEPINLDATDEFGDLAAGFNAMQDAIANREKDIFFIANHDSLSGLPTRDVLVGHLRDTMNDAETIAIVNIALDRFTDIASTLGHGIADQVIGRVAETLRALVGDDVHLGHVSQPEFVILLPETNTAKAIELVTAVRERLRAGIQLSGANISLQVSAGIALYPDHRRDAPELLRCAAIARTNGGQHLMRVGIYDPAQDQRARRSVKIVGDLPAALESGALEVVYQAKVDIATDAVVGAEALVRWDHPDLGRLSPAEFVTAIEQAGGITHLTRYVLARAADQCAAWQGVGISVPISVNISVDDLEDENLPYRLLELTSSRGLQPQQLTLEVTESSIMRNIETSLAVIHCMRELGFRLAIDDFGTGQASLTQLKRIAADELKIDKSFVRNLAQPQDGAIVRAAIELAHQFGLEAVAEGVEDASSLERLRALGCQTAQGFFCARPLAPAAFVKWLRTRRVGDEQDLLRLIGAAG